MSGLPAFLSARVDEDESVALNAVRWSEGARKWCDDGDPDWKHIARFDPDRVLREVEAKRKILAIHYPTKHDYRTQVCQGCGYTGDLDEPITDNIDDCPMLRVTASVYSDHPDYKQEWADIA